MACISLVIYNMKYLVILIILIIGNLSKADWSSEVNFKSLSTTAQDVAFIKTSLDELLTPIKMSLIPDSIDIDEKIFGILPSGAPTVLISKDFSIRIVYFKVVDESHNLKTAYIYIISSRNLEIKLNETAKYFFNKDKALPYRMALIEQPQSAYFEMDLSPKSLHLESK